LLGRPVAGIKNTDALTQSPVELVRPCVYHIENFRWALKSVEKCPIQGTANGAGVISKHPFILFFRKQLPLKFIIAEQFIKKLAAILFWNQHNRIIMAGAGDFNGIIGSRQIAMALNQSMRTQVFVLLHLK